MLVLLYIHRLYKVFQQYTLNAFYFLSFPLISILNSLKISNPLNLYIISGFPFSFFLYFSVSIINPCNFNSVVLGLIVSKFLSVLSANSDVVKPLGNTLANSIIFSGQKGIGKSTFVFNLLKEIFKLSVNENQIMHHLNLIDTIKKTTCIVVLEKILCVKK